MLTLSLIVDMGILSSFSELECRGQGGRLILLFVCVLLGTVFGFRCEFLTTGLVRSPAEADLSNTLRVLGAAALGRGQSITCFILTYKMQEKRNPNIGITDIPTPTAASIIRWSRMWFVNCRMHPCK